MSRGSAAAVLLLAGLAAPAACQNGIVVQSDGAPGTVKIVNSGAPVSLARKVLVERKRDGRWVAANVIFELIETCSEKPPACREVATGATLRPLPWNGYTCSGQCTRSCRSNRYAGPGTFRFVVVGCDQKRRFAGPEFTLPAEKK